MAPRRRRRPLRSRAGTVELIVSLVIAAALTVYVIPRDTPRHPHSTTSYPTVAVLAAVWPSAQTVAVPATLIDGTPIRPLAFLSERVLLGIAPTADGAAVRLIVNDGGTRLNEIRRYPADRVPNIDAVASTDVDVVWTETDAGEPASSVLWRASWRQSDRPVTIATHVGAMVFAGGTDDLQIVDGRIIWLTNATDGSPVTELRSIKLDGSSPGVRRLPGVYQPARWPWVADASGEAGQPVTLFNTTTGRTLSVTADPTEVLNCTPGWCQILDLRADGVPAGLDVMRTDMRERRPVADAASRPVPACISLLDRFHVLLTRSSAPSVSDTQQALLYDSQLGRLVLVASNVLDVRCRAGLFSWLTAEDGRQLWRTLNLRALR